MMLFRLPLLLALIVAGAQPCSMVSVKTLWTKALGSDSKLFAFAENGHVGFIDPSGAIVVEPTIEAHVTQLENFSEELLPVGNDGYIDEGGNWVIRGEYYSLGDFSDGIAAVTVPDDTVRYRMRTAYIDKTGAEILSAPGRSGEDFSEGLATFVDFGKPGVRDFDSEPPIYRDYPGLEGHFDKTGEIVIEAQFADAGPFADGLARVVVDGYCRVVNPSNGQQGSPTSGYPGSCGGAPDDATSICPVGFIDKAGAFAIEPQFESALDFSGDYAGVRIAGQWGFIDRDGEVVVAPRFERVFSFREGLAAVKLDGKWGFVTAEGTIAIEPQFDWASSFSESLAVVGQGNRPSYINRDGTIAFAGSYSVATTFRHGLATVQFSRRHIGYINKSGQTVFEYFQE